MLIEIKKAPQKPGVYLFKDKKGVSLYVGKAANLKNRVRQYLNPVRSREGPPRTKQDAKHVRGFVRGPQRASASNGVNRKSLSPFLEHLLDEATKIEFKITDSEIEALILESKLIKKLQPKYNIMFRDDKQYFYVVITKEKFPKIFLTHRPFDSLRSLRANPEFTFIGPFTDGTALKTTLRLLRRIFPYCTCKQKHNNFCLNYHIGKCLGICCLKQQSRNFKFSISNFKKLSGDYKRNIKAIKDILSGKRNSLIRKLRKELTQLAKEQKFEEAIKLRNQVEKLERVFENAKILSDAKNANLHANDANTLKELKKVFKLPRLPRRIEGYDVSNIQGKNATGAMVVFDFGRPDPEGVRQGGPYGASKNDYRKFRIRFKETPDDIAMLKEVLARRFKHDGWPKPDLIFIDGGKGQLNAADGVISNFEFLISKQIPNIKYQIPIISLAKGRQEVFSTTLEKPILLKKLPTGVRNLIRQIDAEAHRFAIKYYRKLQRSAVYK